ncbi:hypothetical protein, partial [Gilliamella sp. W8128]|uniref:hypothetical protein n=1 Tax=Gilliamella sp. W8128 TaxID=2751010 RepID=UPI001E57C564
FLIVKLRFAFLPTAFIVYWILVHYRVGSIEIYKWMYNQEIYCLLSRLKNRILKAIDAISLIFISYVIPKS